MHSTLISQAGDFEYNKLELSANNGALEFKLPNGGKSSLAYGTGTTFERFRGTIELPAELRQALEKNGWLISEDATVAERVDHPWFVCVQFHPEYKSRLTKAGPLFESFIEEVKNGDKCRVANDS